MYILYLKADSRVDHFQELNYDSTFQGLAGGKIIVYPSSKHPENYKAEENIIVGNVCFYGATAGKVKVTVTSNWLIKDLSLEDKLILCWNIV